MSTIQSQAHSSMMVLRNQIANTLWAQFILKHQDFSSALTEFHQ